MSSEVVTVVTFSSESCHVKVVTVAKYRKLAIVVNVVKVVKVFKVVIAKTLDDCQNNELL